jgi:hypothetical protein
VLYEMLSGVRAFPRYLKGLYDARSRTPDSMARAEKHFERAIELRWTRTSSVEPAHRLAARGFGARGHRGYQIV